jgi:hypothetical protein
MTLSPPMTITAEEQEQLAQTIEMFEVITQANPQDCQSMEILKDAYQRIGKQEQSLGIARKLADTYVELGQYSAAMLEYEGILKKTPDNPEVIAALSEVEEKLQKSGQLKSPPSSGPTIIPSPISLDFRKAVNESGTLITTAATLRNDTAGAVGTPVTVNLADDGNEALAKFLMQHRLVTEEIVASAMERVRKKNSDLKPNQLSLSLIDEICRRGSYEMETLLAGFLERSKFAYIPLEYYDIDRSVVRLLPESLTLGRLIVPFDIMSRTIMVAMANPLDACAKDAVQQLLDYHVQWHLASPQSIAKVLGETYRIEK